MPLPLDHYRVAILSFGENRTYLNNLSQEAFDYINVTQTLKAVERFRHISDFVVVFGSSELWSRCTGPINVETPISYFNNPYTRSKHRLVTSIREKSYRNVHLIHPFNFNTRYRTGDFLFGKIYGSILTRSRVVLGDTYFYRDLVTASDIVNSCINPSVSECIVGSGRLFHVNEVIRELYRSVGLEYDDYVSENINSISIRRQYPYFAAHGTGCDTLDWMKRDLSNAL